MLAAISDLLSGVLLTFLLFGFQSPCSCYGEQVTWFALVHLWYRREFRARLVAGSRPADEASTNGRSAEGAREWAHTVARPEKGCLLLAHPKMFAESQTYFSQASLWPGCLRLDLRHNACPGPFVSSGCRLDAVSLPCSTPAECMLLSAGCHLHSGAFRREQCWTDLEQAHRVFGAPGERLLNTTWLGSLLCTTTPPR